MSKMTVRVFFVKRQPPKKKHRAIDYNRSYSCPRQDLTPRWVQDTQSGIYVEIITDFRTIAEPHGTSRNTGWGQLGVDQGGHVSYRLQLVVARGAHEAETLGAIPRPRVSLQVL